MKEQCGASVLGAPIFVTTCAQHGADRTGTMCAIYRVAEQGWSKEEAIREITDGGFGFHGVFENLLGWVEELDVEAVRQEAAGPRNAHGSKDG